MGLEYEVIETTSPTFVDEWVADFDADSCPYTDIVLVGGDGIFSQYINAVHKHPAERQLLKIPIGILPGGSQNALCCDVGGKSVVAACINIIRGH